ncbi:hypothetical protein QBC44DRAFT_97241 [Cladorrhinum sp. PSN332]|nr:hypothetical protein QBC44DRAFT_97241 [Cladorrhinum sp. PSN332]
MTMIGVGNPGGPFALTFFLLIIICCVLTRSINRRPPYSALLPSVSQNKLPDGTVIYTGRITTSHIYFSGSSFSPGFHLAALSDNSLGITVVSYQQCPISSVLSAVSYQQCPISSVLSAVSYQQCPMRDHPVFNCDLGISKTRPLYLGIFIAGFPPRRRRPRPASNPSEGVKSKRRDQSSRRGPAPILSNIRVVQNERSPSRPVFR